MERHFLDAARHLFLTQGYEATTIDDVIARAGGSKRTLYSRFPNKESLFVAVVTDRITHGFLPVEAMLERFSRDSRTKLRTRLMQIGRVYAEQAMLPESQALDRALNAACHRFPDLRKQLYDKGLRRATGLVRDLLDAAGARESEIATQVFYSLLVLAPLRENWGATTVQMPDVERIVDFVIAGAQISPSRSSGKSPGQKSLSRLVRER